MKLGYFWRFEIPGAIARLLPGNHEKPSSFFIFLLKEVRTRCGVAQERFRKAPQAKDVPRIFGNFKSPVSPHFHAAAHNTVSASLRPRYRPLITAVHMPCSCAC